MENGKLETEKKECEAQLELVIASLKDDPGNTELLKLKSELDEMLLLYSDILGAPAPDEPALPASRTKSSAPPPPTPAEQPKWSRENHPAFKKASAAEEEKEQVPEAVVYQVNDTVMAKWVSGDKGFYPARITSITGSSTVPIYTVKFKSYDTVETLRAKDIRPVGQKRKADGSMVTGSTGGMGANVSTAAVAGELSGGPSNNGIVLSAGAELYPQAQRETDKDKVDEKGKPKFKKIKANKELEAGKNKWQEFNAKGKVSKGAKKDSMFRTPEGVRGRVGFTGSGQAMRKDPTRSRHVYQPNEDLD